MNKILIIDDEQIIIDSIAKHLIEEQYQLFSASNGKEGVTVYEEAEPVLIILDLKMPVMSGIEFLETIRLMPYDPCSVIVLTGHGDDEERERCFELGVSAFLNKPFNAIELKGMVRHSISLKEVELSLQDEITKRMEVEELLLYSNSILTTLNSILKVSLKAIPLDEQLSQILDLATTNLGASDVKGNIYIANTKTGNLELKAKKGFPEKAGSANEVMLISECEQCKAAMNQEIMFQECSRREKESSGSRENYNHYCVPVVLDEKPAGIFNLYIEKGYKRATEDVDFLQSVSNIIAGMLLRNKIINCQ